MLDFLANYWPYLVVLVVVILLFFVLRGFLKGLKARSPFNMENIRKSTEPNFLALQQKSKALLADADMICEIKPGSDQVTPRKKTLNFSVAPFRKSSSLQCSKYRAQTRSCSSSARPKLASRGDSRTWSSTRSSAKVSLLTSTLLLVKS